MKQALIAFMTLVFCCFNSGGMIVASETSNLEEETEYSISDIVLLQKWLLGYKNIVFDKGWKYYNCYPDDRLDVFDLCIMKRIILENKNEKLETVLEFYNQDSLMFSYPITDTAKESIVLPGIPDTIRLADACFLYYSLNDDGTGKRYYPGDNYICDVGVNRLYLIWEDSVSTSCSATVYQNLAQSFEKTADRPTTYSSQGGTYAVHDGESYWIQAYAREISDQTAEAFKVESAGNYTALFVYDLQTGQIESQRFDIPYGHANDLEYNPDTNQIIMCSAFAEGEAITVVDLDLQTYYQVTPPETAGLRVVGCSYHETDHLYYLTTMPVDSNYLRDCSEILLYDEQWNLVKKIRAPFVEPENHYGFQGADIYLNKYYLVNFLKDNMQENGKNSFQYARISIYDCTDMSYLGSIPISVTDEIEDISVCDTGIYLNGQIYKNKESGRIEIRIYEFG